MTSQRWRNESEVDRPPWKHRAYRRRTGAGHHRSRPIDYRRRRERGL